MEAAALNFHGRAQVWNAQFYGYWMHRVLDSEGDWFKADVHVQRHLVSSYKVDGAAREHQTMEAAFTSGKSAKFSTVRTHCLAEFDLSLADVKNKRLEVWPYGARSRR